MHHEFNKETYKLIDGHITNKNVIGYCHCNTHYGYLSKKLYKSHECEIKNCPFLEINKNNEYLKNKDRDKVNTRKIRKIRKMYHSGDIPEDIFMKIQLIYKKDKNYFYHNVYFDENNNLIYKN